METIKILWTGGYDSTFRICQLSKMPVNIQPYYLSNNNRKSAENELSAIDAITEALKKKADTKCDFMELIVFPAEDIFSYKTISASFRVLRKKDFLEAQYEYLAWFARRNPTIELPVHKDDKIVELISKYGAFKKSSETDDYSFVDRNNSSDEIIDVFGNFRFPLIEFTKKEIGEQYALLNCADIMRLTWFCRTPINNKPCGVCSPCRDKIKEGSVSGFDATALTRNKHILYRVKNYFSK